MLVLRTIAMVVLLGTLNTSVSAQTAATTESGPSLIVYYFHGEFRCENCLAIEAAAAATLRAHYGDQLASGAIVWRALNVQTPEHEHFAAEFHLASQALILVDPHSGQPPRWQDLDWIWNLVGDDDAFAQRLVRDIEAFVADTTRTDEEQP